MGAALPTPILLAPEDDWQFFIELSPMWSVWLVHRCHISTNDRCAVSNLSSQAGQKARPVTDSATARSQRIGRLAALSLVWHDA